MKKLFLWLSLMAIGMVIAICVPLLASPSPHQEYPVGSPPFTEGIFPCSNCHAGLETNAKRRELKDEHTSIKLRHAEQERWCLDCHNAANRDKLKLADGETIAFTESYRLCGQCHGNIYKDWKAGIHGKRVGYFKGGKRTYFLCVNCHNPHDPAFKPIQPLPPPVRPELNNAR
jgi:cytochrome c553